MKDKGLDMPLTLDAEDVGYMSGHNLKNANFNILEAREDLLSQFGKYAQPKADEMLHEWLDQLGKFSKGNRIEDDIFELNRHKRRVSIFCF